jgi:hypothetical protein
MEDANSLRSLSRIGRSHQIAPRRNGVLFLESQDDARAARHKFGQLAKEGPFGVDSIETFGLLQALVDKFHSADLESGTQNTIYDLSVIPCPNRVGLNDSKC